MTQNVVLYTVEINVENPDNLLLPYLTANVHFVLSHETDALLVPSAALPWAPSSLEEIAADARSNVQNAPTLDPPALMRRLKKRPDQNQPAAHFG